MRDRNVKSCYLQDCHKTKASAQILDSTPVEKHRKASFSFHLKKKKACWVYTYDHIWDKEVSPAKMNLWKWLTGLAVLGGTSSSRLPFLSASLFLQSTMQGLWPSLTGLKLWAGTIESWILNTEPVARAVCTGPGSCQSEPLRWRILWFSLLT